MHAQTAGVGCRQGESVRTTGSGLAGLACALAVHAALGLGLHIWSALSTAHALATLGLALWAGLRWPLVKVACVGAYIVGAEVLWRMTGARIPWEFGKYAISLAFFLAILRLGHNAKWRLLPMLYFGALIPSIIVVLADTNLSGREVVNMLSFNLSGPLSLLASAWFASHLRLGRQELREIFLALLAPIVGIASVALFATVTATDLFFAEESNLVTSGGFGPNQVSVILALGALVALLYGLQQELSVPVRSLFLLLMLGLGIQSAMTFSRGGLYSAVGAACVAFWYFGRDRGARQRLVFLFLAAALLVSTVILPRLNEFTEGALIARYRDLDLSQRDVLMREHLRLWVESPILGRGPGGARVQLETMSRISHTEYTRLLAEHGILGIVALWALAAMYVRQLSYRESYLERGTRVALLAWSLISMLHVGMRLAGLGFLIGLAQARALGKPPDPTTRRGILPDRTEPGVVLKHTVNDPRS